MTPLPRRLRLAAALSVALIAVAAQAQPTSQPTPPATPPAAEPTSPAPIVRPAPAAPAQSLKAAMAEEAKASALSAELFYEVLVGEITARSGDPGAGYALVLDAAKRARDPELFQRAVEIALQSRSGEAALAAARAWKESVPNSREARRFELQILIALNRIEETAEPLRVEIAATPLPERPFLMTVVARTYARATDKKQAAAVVERALVDELKNPDTASFAWAAVGRLRLAAGDPTGALEAAIQGQQADPSSDAPPLLALELMDPDRPLAEPMVKRYLATPNALPELRIAYARELMEARRYADATAELAILTRDKPELPAPWILLGSLQAQNQQNAEAEASIKRYLALVEPLPAADEGRRGLTQAYLLLSQLAERRKDFADAERWLGRVDNSDEAQLVQMRRAGLLARQGKMQQARELVRALPASTPDEVKQRFQAEVQLLRDAKQYQAAYDMLATASAAEPSDTDLIYDQAMMAEKINRLDEMERLLRRQIALKPESQNADNALGYSFADRKIRLEEARTLIRKAVELAPQDPFIADSLGWVEFRMGNTAEATKILEAAYQRRPDAEIGAHLGEVLWVAGNRDRAMTIWREASLVDAENETLQETLKRLRIKL